MSQRLNWINGNMKKETYVFLFHIITDVPGPITDLKPVVVTRKLMMLNWGDPDDDGGSDVISFIIERKEPKSHTWKQPMETPSSKCEIVGIMEGQEYLFRVVAKNKYGCGPPVDLGPIRAVDPLCKGNDFYSFAWYYHI